MGFNQVNEQTIASHERPPPAIPNYVFFPCFLSPSILTFFRSGGNLNNFTLDASLLTIFIQKFPILDYLSLLGSHHYEYHLGIYC